MKYYTLKASSSSNVIKKLATWHNLTPQLWLEDYYPTDDEIENTIKRMITNPCYIGVAEDEDVVGFIWAEKHEDHVMIVSLYIDEQYRKQNVASHLKKDLETWCLKEGIEKIKTTVHSKNKNMLALNEKLGYESKMIHMEKKLSKR